MINKILMYDKVLHFIYSFFLVMTFSHFLSIHTAYMTTLVLGLLKEIWDYYVEKRELYNTCGDMMANFFGAMLAIYLLLIIM